MQYLILAKLLLVNPAEIVVKGGKGAESRGPRTRSWWAFRVLLIQQRVLAERSASLRSLLVTASLGMVAHFGASEAVDRLNWKFDPSEAKSVVAAAHLEIGLMEHVYGHDDAARSASDRGGKTQLSNSPGLSICVFLYSVKVRKFGVRELGEFIGGLLVFCRECFDRAAKSCGLELSLTGILGFRTQYQVGTSQPL